MKAYTISYYNNRREPPYHQTIIKSDDSGNVIQTARNYKNKHGDRTDVFTITTNGEVVYDSTMGRYIDD